MSKPTTTAISVKKSNTKKATKNKVFVPKKKDTKKNKKKVNILDTDYGREVLSVNVDLKRACKTIGGARAILLTLNAEGKINLFPYQLTILKASKKTQSVYEGLKAVTFHHKKSGKPSPFYVLQAMYNTKKRTQLMNIIKNNK